jgi:DMSO/TMAO reductase YedYZ molybdopterin-dependent catalytic subunit
MTERSLEELYRDDPERADALAFGRRAGASRRGFLEGAGLAAMGAAIGGAIPFAAGMPEGLVPIGLVSSALAQGAAPPAAPAAQPQAPRRLEYPGKDGGLVLLQERPLVAETPEHLLDDETTPTAKFFVRNNGQIPDEARDRNAWRLKIDGEVNAVLDLSLGDIRSRFPAKTFRLQMECGGNGRSFFAPATSGNQWGNGAIGVAEWTGVSLGDVLRAAGVKPSAVYTANFGADPHLSGDAQRQSISRGVPMAKAMEEHTLIAWAMNGQDLPHIHGGPVRLLTPGWPGSASHKWVTRIWVRDREHDGPGMTGTQYRVPIQPMIPGSRAVDANMRVLESMPLRSIISSPANGTRLAAGTREIALRGAAWAGEKTVRAVHVSVDFGQSWTEARLAPPKNKYDWQRWTAALRVPSDGYYELWSRATDSDGKMQPHAAANWNPQGYGANPFHRVAVLIGG